MPSELAREALKQLAARHLAPTPENFHHAYNEVAGLPDVQPVPEAQLRKLVSTLVPDCAIQQRHLQDLELALARGHWTGVLDILIAFAEAGRGRIASAVEEQRVLSPEFAEVLARWIESLLAALSDEEHDVRAIGDEFLRELREPFPAKARLLSLFPAFSRQVRFAAEEQSEIRHSLLKLLHLVIENIAELSIDDQWFKGQVDGLLATVVPPLKLRHLDEMERRLRDVVDKQTKAKARSVEVQDEMRRMLSAFIGQLAEMNASSVSFQGDMEESVRQMAKIERIEDLAPLLDTVITRTRSMADETTRVRGQLEELQERVRTTEAELLQLHKELDTASSLARHDPLTDALNRKGLDEVLAREIANMQRKGGVLSLSLLDIDNFKALNDRLGHEAGDVALVHLANIARGCMRPNDTLARYGGEEFVILMPDTDVEKGIEIMTRLQRELTKAIFMSGSERVLITFSAGVAQLGTDENGSDAIRRADQAMYLAKRAGKNRVMAA